MRLKIKIIIFLSIVLMMANGIVAQYKVTSALTELYPDATFICTNHDERVGYSIAGAGDINGDGYDDFMVAAYHNYLHGWNSGGVYIFLGGMNVAWGYNINIEDAATAVFRGNHPYDLLGYNVAGRGDFNGDGLDDVIIGAPGHWDRDPATPGWTYIVFGKEDIDWGKDFVLTSNADVRLLGEKNLDQLGYANAFVGDINHDGFDDILTSAAYRNQYARWDGKAYLVLGDSTGWGETDLITQKAVASFVYPYDEAVVGYSVAGVGDVNNDGTPDFVIGVPGANMACLILGRPEVDWGDDFNLANADYKFLGEYEGDYAGSYISFANDVNNDGYNDFLISAIKSYFEAGRIYLIFGRDTWTNREISLSTADASFLGEDVNTHTGFSTSGLIDYDGDGFDDFLIGARYLNGPYPHSGKLYLIKGKPDGWEHDYNLEQVPDYFWGDDSITCAGWQVADVGDVNGDNAHDFVTSGPFNSTGAHWGGKIFFFKGKNVSYQVSGSVNYYSQHQPMKDVILKLSGLMQDSVVTTSDGTYQFLLPPNGNFLVTPSKQLTSENVLMAINAYDAALVARHSIQIDSLKDYAFIAGDVDRDNRVRMYDAAQIARYVVELPPLENSHVGELLFDPQFRSYDNLNSSFLDQDYTGIILGDVDGSWQTEPLIKKNARTLVSILPEKIVGFLNKKLKIPLRIIDQKEVLSIDIEIYYDKNQLQFRNILKMPITKDFNLIYNDLVKGELKIAMYTHQPVELDGDLIEIEFDAIANKKRTVSDFEISLLRVNNQPPYSDKTKVYIFDKDYLKNSVKIVAKPNPFNPVTKIHLTNADMGKGKLIIFDIMGREVRHFDLNSYSSNAYEFVWDGKDNAGSELASGVYFIKYIYQQNISTCKIIKLK